MSRQSHFNRAIARLWGRGPRTALLALAGLCLLAASPLHAQTGGWKADWDRTVAAANREGKIVISGPSGRIWREFLKNFHKAYPKIEVQITPSASRNFWPRVMKEYEVGKHLWDLRVGGPDHLSYLLKAKGFMAPIRSLLVLPEVTDDSKWHGGLNGIFLDKDDKYFLGFAIYEQVIAFYNSDIIKDPSIEDMKNIVDPKWSGKISMAEPRGGSPLTGLGVLYRRFGKQFVEDFLVKQKPVVAAQGRQQMDWMARGRYPITFGMPSSTFVEYQKRGFDITRFKPIRGTHGWSQGVGGIQLLKGGPHPNAAKVFINWILTRDVQARLMKAVKLNSRRKDIPLGNPDVAIDTSKLDQYIGGQTEEMQEYQTKVRKLIRALGKQ